MKLFRKVGRWTVTFFCNFFFSDLFVYVVHNKVDDFWSKQFGWQLIVVHVPVEIEVGLEDMLRFVLKLLKGTGQMITQFGI